MASAVKRTFGWIQNPGELKTLRKIVLCLCNNTKENNWLLKERLPFLLKNRFISQGDYDRFSSILNANIFPYTDLKGKGSGSKSRKDAICTGIIQAIIDAQSDVIIKDSSGNDVKIKKPYSDDWTSEGYLRWCVITGFLEYNENNDTCTPTEMALKLEKEDYNGSVMQQAILSYPPANRVLSILSDNQLHTKFEIGSRIGFIGEKGFSSIEQALFVASYNEADKKERTKIKSNMEGDSDKYARMIAGWLNKLGWVETDNKTITEEYLGKTYSMTQLAYRITLKGIQALKSSTSYSSNRGIDKRVMFQMLASGKAASPDYLRKRRSIIIDSLSKGDKDENQLLSRLNTEKIKANAITVSDDIKGLVNIGLNIEKKSNGKYHLKDKIIGLQIPTNLEELPTDVEDLKTTVRENLKYIDHKYLVLIDLAYSPAPSKGKKNADARDFEYKTADLFTKELNFQGMRLGDSEKPDVIVSYNDNGVIIDNKSYKDGFSVDKGCSDEMTRYVIQNRDRKQNVPPNEWWKSFSSEVNKDKVNFLFITSYLKGNYSKNLQGISDLTNGVMGGAIGVKDLLYTADRLKAEQLSYNEFFDLFQNDAIISEPVNL